MYVFKLVFPKLIIKFTLKNFLNLPISFKYLQGGCWHDCQGMIVKDRLKLHGLLTNEIVKYIPWNINEEFIAFKHFKLLVFC